MKKLFFASLTLIAAAFGATPLLAHPHVFVTMQTNVVYGADQSITGFKQSWTFDAMYSSFATHGLDGNADGKLDRAELQSLADVNVQSLKEFEYFTYPKARGANLALQEPRDYWLEFENELLTLHFTIDLATPLSANDQQDFSFKIYDRVNYISFQFARGTPVKLAGGPSDCAFTIIRPGAAPAPTTLNETYFESLDPSADFGAQFAPTVRLACGPQAIAMAASQTENEASDKLDTQNTLTASDTADGQPLAAAPGVWGRIQATQNYLSTRIGGAVRDLKDKDPWLAGLTMAFFSFVYGVVHAAGPGHGKAIISSYVLANERTLRRGVILAVLASLAQAISAIAIVGVLTIAMRAANLQVEALVGNLETFSFAMIALIGGWMLIGAVRRGLPAFAVSPRPMTSLSAAATPARHAHSHAHAHHAHGPNCGCGHNHAPDPSQLDGDLSWRKAAAIILAIGVRPCSGAIIVLVFALSQGLFWAGVASTFAMAVGTAITVSVLAVLAVGSRNLAVRWMGGDSVMARRVEAGTAIGGALFILVLGAVFFATSLGPAKPFVF